MQFVANHRYAVHVWKLVPRNHAVVICSDIFHMFMVHVIFTCLWFMLNGLERFCNFSPEVSTQSPLPNSCLEYGGLQCSHIFIIHCAFYCFHSWFISFPGAFQFVIYFHVFSCLFVFFIFYFFHICSFCFIFSFPFFSWKNITHLNHLHVDPRLSSAETWLFERPKKMNNDWLVVSTIVYSPFHIWDVILPDG